MLVSDVVDLFTSAGLGTVSTTASNGTLFENNMPDDPDDALVVMETGGLPTVKTMGNQGPEFPSIEVIVRSADQVAGRLRAHQVWRLIDGGTTAAQTWPRTINGTSYQYGTARQSPMLVGRDAQSRWLFTFNADLVKAISTTS